MSQKITLTRALVEVKNLDDRIGAAITGGLFVALERGIGNPRPVDTQFKDKGEVHTKIAASKDQIEGLIARRSALKRAISEANVNTKVTIAGKQMSIVEAIDYKKVLEFKRTLTQKARLQLTHAAQSIEQNRLRMEEDVKKHTEAILGKDGNAKNVVDQNASMIELTRKTIIDQHELRMIDPLDIKKYIETLQQEIQDATNEIDFVLSEVNAQTFIEI